MTLFSFFNVFRYITFRTIYAILTALLISFHHRALADQQIEGLSDSTGGEGGCSFPAHG